MTDEEFNIEVSEGNVAVKFWAEWCMPCQMLTPIYEEISKEVNNVKFKAINIDGSDIPRKYGVRSIPTIVLFKNGEEVDRITNVVHKERIKKKILETFE